MKNDIVLYKRIYQLLKNQIVCGLIPSGSKLPSRADLCRELHVSEKTVRQVLVLLSEDGLIVTEQRKRPVVTGPDKADLERQKEAVPLNTRLADDILSTGKLICYPIVEKGISLCTGKDWEIPATLAARMDPLNSTEFWRLSHRFWRFFISRIGNDLIVRAVDSLGLSDLDPLPKTLEFREDYLKSLHEFLGTVSRGGRPVNIFFGDFPSIFGLTGQEAFTGNLYRVAPDSPLHMGLEGLEQKLRSAEERYSRVYMDILGLITIGRYHPGDRLPSHAELQQQYGVSIDTTIKAIRVLQEWGVVTAKRGSGIFVAMDLEGLKKARIPTELLACHVRRFLDSLELLSLTIEGVAAHAAGSVTAADATGLRDRLEQLWSEEYLYQLTPVELLEFITKHITYISLKEIYQVVTKYYHIGRSIPKLVSTCKNEKNEEIHRWALQAADSLILGDGPKFSSLCAGLFHHVHDLIVEECKKLGYLELAGQVYDGTALWRERASLVRH